MTTSFYPFVSGCPTCGFDIETWDMPDAIRTISHATDLVDLACESMRPELLDQHPDETSASIADQIIGLSEFLHTVRGMIVHAIRGPEPTDEERESSFQPVLESLGHETELTMGVLRDLTPAGWDGSVPEANTGHETVGLAVRHLAHAVLHLQTTIGATRTELGDIVDIGRGEVVQVSGSGGGLPKLPLLTATIDKTGVVGDRQATRRHHGAPFQALCLFSAEVVDEFQAQGHPITYGSAGENITIRGLEWSNLRAGLEIKIGEVLCRLTAPAVPCSQNTPWFSDGDFSRLSHDKHPGQSRWYASVVSGGTVNPGDEVNLA
ncbi:MAG: MOSC domain-containing protein [Acidimicrobiia bacterium]|nr:MOSC domain-containing protein [Acidimicrobiia bacterium]